MCGGTAGRSLLGGGLCTVALLLTQCQPRRWEVHGWLCFLVLCPGNEWGTAFSSRNVTSMPAACVCFMQAWPCKKSRSLSNCRPSWAESSRAGGCWELCAWTQPQPDAVIWCACPPPPQMHCRGGSKHACCRGGGCITQKRVGCSHQASRDVPLMCARAVEARPLVFYRTSGSDTAPRPVALTSLWAWSRRLAQSISSSPNSSLSSRACEGGRLSTDTRSALLWLLAGDENPLLLWGLII